jgi:D-threonate/D-erythronate kinase
MAIELLIIADDLTGAADTAVQFSKKGIRSELFLTPAPDLRRVDKSVKVVAVTTGSRHCSRSEAKKRVAAVVKKARRQSCRRFYKKIDSTFRGNVGGELEALMEAAGAERLMLVPAYPAAGRTTKAGYQYVDGSLLQKSGFARDPLEPATESFIPAILGKGTRLPVHIVGRQAVIAGKMPGKNPKGIFVFDAENDADLRRTGEFLDKSGNLDVAAGAAGFASMLSTYYGLQTFPGRIRPFSGPARPLLIVNGSLNDVSLRQVAQAEQEGVSVFLLGADADVPSIVQRLNDEGCALVTTARARGGKAGPAPDAYARKAASLAAAVVRRVPGAALALFGGDTAAAVCRALGVKTLYPFDEIVPGLTVCSVSGQAVRGAVILKSGGFGPDDVVGKIRHYLTYSAKARFNILFYN